MYITYSNNEICVHVKDVRSEEEFKVSHLSKALLVNPETGDMEELMKLITEKGA